MTDKEYHDTCAALFEELEGLLDDAGADYDNNGNVLEITTEAGDIIIINKQTPKHEIWLAARGGGRHFHLADGDWYDTRDKTQLKAQLLALLNA